MTEKISPSSSWHYKPLPRQIRAITKLQVALHQPEPVEYPRTRLEARDLIFELRRRLKQKENENRNGMVG